MATKRRARRSVRDPIEEERHEHAVNFYKRAYDCLPVFVDAE